VETERPRYRQRRVLPRERRDSLTGIADKRYAIVAPFRHDHLGDLVVVDLGRWRTLRQGTGNQPAKRAVRMLYCARLRSGPPAGCSARQRQASGYADGS
jgi:hypothetical protein